MAASKNEQADASTTPSKVESSRASHSAEGVSKTSQTVHFEKWTSEQVTEWLKEEEISYFFSLNFEYLRSFVRNYRKYFTVLCEVLKTF